MSGGNVNTSAAAAGQSGAAGCARLVPCRWLDPRPASEAARQPIHEAVNIPLDELPARTHELPPRRETIHVAGSADLVARTIPWLSENGRLGAPAPAFSYGLPGATSDIGRLWRPNAFLAEVLPHLPPAAALDLACGTGRDAVYLASRGWTVTAVDVLPDAIARAQDLERRCAPAIRPIQWHVHDLERSPLLLHRRFDLITFFRYLHRPLFARLPDWLTPGGSAICETFTTLHRQRHGRPTRDEHVLQEDELPRLVPGFEIRHYSEAWRGEDHTARLWAVLTR